MTYYVNREDLVNALDRSERHADEMLEGKKKGTEKLQNMQKRYRNDAEHAEKMQNMQKRYRTCRNDK